MNWHRQFLILIMAMVLSAPAVPAAALIVNPDRTGDFVTIQEAINAAQPGDEVVIVAGTYAERLSTQRHGTVTARITLKAAQGAQVVITQPGLVLDVRHAFITLEGLVFDGQFGSQDVIRVQSTGDYLTFRKNEVRHGARDGIDLGENAISLAPGFNFLEGVVIEDSYFHDFLWNDNGERRDAHAIVAGGVINFTIRNTEVSYVSGDALQLQDGGWDDVLVENVKFWNGALPGDQAGFAAGINPGENAIDTKQDSNLPYRGTLTIRNSAFFGWQSHLITNSAALNLKEKVTAALNGNVLYDNEIALRLRGRTDDAGAYVTAVNNVLYENKTAVRYEDQIKNLHIYNNTFGTNDHLFQSVGGAGENFTVLNNLFLGTTKPNEASNPSNIAVTANNFVDSLTHDYRLTETSVAIDAGLTLNAVSTDRDSTGRPQGSAFDVGAYEFTSSRFFDRKQYRLVDSKSLSAGKDMSGMTYHPGTGHLWIVNETSSIAEITPAGDILRRIDLTGTSGFDIEGITFVRTEGNGVDVFGLPDEVGGRLLIVRIAPDASTVDLSATEAYSVAGSTSSLESIGYNTEADNNVFYVAQKGGENLYKLTLANGSMTTETLPFDVFHTAGNVVAMYFHPKLSRHIFMLIKTSPYVVKEVSFTGEVMSTLTLPSFVSGKVEGMAFNPHDGSLFLVRESSVGVTNYWRFAPDSGAGPSNDGMPPRPPMNMRFN